MLRSFFNKLPNKSYENLGLSLLFAGYGTIYGKCGYDSKNKFIDFDRIKENKSKIEAVDGPKLIIFILSSAFLSRSAYHLIKFIKT
jgi:hypothetical protein